MNAAKHSPGPWVVGEFDDCLGYDCMTAGVKAGPVYLDGKHYGQQRCREITEESKAAMMADAALIAAAPELLDALQHSQGILNQVLLELRINDVGVHPNLIVALRKGREAIAKATEASHG